MCIAGCFLHFSCSEGILNRGGMVGSMWTDLQLLCRQPRDRRPSPLTGQNQTLYKQGCCWWGCFVQPDLDGHIPCLRGTSSPLLCPGAYQPAGWLWTGYRVSATEAEYKGRSASSTDHKTNAGQSTAATLAQDLIFMICSDPAAACWIWWNSLWGKHLMSRSPCTRWQSSLVYLETHKEHVW